MFDRLIESDTTAAERDSRRGYFMVSSIVVGILFLIAVVVSLYAEDLTLGVSDFEMTELLTPAIPTEAPEPPSPAAPRQPNQQVSELPTRQANIPRIEEQPLTPPTEISATPMTQQVRPEGRFIITDGPDRPGIGQQGAVRGIGDGNPTGTASVETSEPALAKEPEPEPPPIKRPPIKSEGVINGKATYLPKPSYPAAAHTMRIEGNVDVQVTIDEKGNVISAKAVNGHPMLRQAAEKAAWDAKFTPTYLTRVPVKVTGVIVYKFSRS